MGLPTVLFAGGGAFGLPSLRRLLDARYPVIHVVTQPDRPAGRGQKTTPTPIARFAELRGLNLTRTSAINDAVLPQAQVMVVIAFGQKIGRHVADAPPMGSINLHASLLPRYRGAAPVNWAILHRERRTGNSIIRLADRMDAGAVLGQSELEIGKAETAGELHDRLAEDGATLLLRVLEQMAAGGAREILQDESLASKAPKLDRASTALDWRRPAEAIASQIRGLSPWPGCRVRLVSESGERLAQLSLLRAMSVETGSGGHVGRIDAAGRIIAGDGVVQLLDVQPEGKRSMTFQQFLNGHAWPAGARLESII